jgi:hypothetical protein
MPCLQSNSRAPAFNGCLLCLPIQYQYLSTSRISRGLSRKFFSLFSCLSVSLQAAFKDGRIQGSPNLALRPCATVAMHLSGLIKDWSPNIGPYSKAFVFFAALFCILQFLDVKEAVKDVAASS